MCPTAHHTDPAGADHAKGEEIAVRYGGRGAIFKLTCLPLSSVQCTSFPTDIGDWSAVMVVSWLLLVRGFQVDGLELSDSQTADGARKRRRPQRLVPEIPTVAGEPKRKRPPKSESGSLKAMTAAFKRSEEANKRLRAELNEVRAELENVKSTNRMLEGQVEQLQGRGLSLTVSRMLQSTSSQINGHLTDVYKHPTDSATDSNGEQGRATIGASDTVEPAEVIGNCVKSDGGRECEWLTTGSTFLGARVTRVFNGKHYSGTVARWAPRSGDDEALWKIAHDDGDREDLDEEQLKAAINLFDENQRSQRQKEEKEEKEEEEEESKRHKESSKFREGSRVEVLFDLPFGRKKYYPGRVTNCLATGDYTVAFDDGEIRDCRDEDMRLLIDEEDARLDVRGATCSSQGIPDIIVRGSVCCICTGSFETMALDTRICQLQCKHAMCAECIEHWFDTSDLGEDESGEAIRSGKTCPECRRGFASLRKSDTATLAEIIALQRNRTDVPTRASVQPVRPRREQLRCRTKAGAHLRCEYCDAAISGRYGSGRFCNRICKNTWCNHAGRRAQRWDMSLRPGLDQNGADQPPQKRQRVSNVTSASRRHFQAGTTLDCPSCSQKLRAPIAARGLRCPNCYVIIEY